MSYLRFTPEDYRTLCRRCRSVDLRAVTLAAFRPLVVQLLGGDWPELADRMAQLDQAQLRLLLDHLKARRGQAPRAGQPDTKAETLGLSAADLRVVERAGQRYLLYDGRLSAFQAFLVHVFRQETPALARKLDRLDRRQVRKLFERVKGLSRWRV